MRYEEARLAEALTEEQSWEAEGVVVLTASVSLPQLAGGGGRAKRFNRYYRRLCRAYFSYCRQVLLPEAAEALRAAMAVSAPWSVSRAELRHTIALRAGEVLSVVCDSREQCSGKADFLLRRSEVWDLTVGLPMPIEEFFPPRKRCKKALVRFAREETLRRLERGEAVPRENWRSALRRALDLRSFYLTPEGLCFFYPMYAVGPDILTFTMPYDDENGPFPPTEA